MDNKNQQSFHRKIFKKATDVFCLSPHTESTEPRKIVPSSIPDPMKEELRRIFLPRMIEIFQLRKGDFELPGKENSPEELLVKLQAMQEEIEEVRRWIEGVSSQITKTIEEVKAGKEYEPQAKERPSFWNRLLSLPNNPPQKHDPQIG